MWPVGEAQIATIRELRRISSEGREQKRGFGETFNGRCGRERKVAMKTKLAIVVAVAAAALFGGGLARADASPPPGQPDPNAPKCWTPTPDGWLHMQLVPCGWTYSDEGGWQRLPPPP